MWLVVCVAPPHPARRIQHIAPSAPHPTHRLIDTVLTEHVAANNEAGRPDEKGCAARACHLLRQLLLASPQGEGEVGADVGKLHKRRAPHVAQRLVKVGEGGRGGVGVGMRYGGRGGRGG